MDQQPRSGLAADARGWRVTDAITSEGYRERVLTRFAALAAAIALNHRLGHTIRCGGSCLPRILRRSYLLLLASMLRKRDHRPPRSRVGRGGAA